MSPVARPHSLPPLVSRTCRKGTIGPRIAILALRLAQLHGSCQHFLCGTEARAFILLHPRIEELAADTTERMGRRFTCRDRAIATFVRLLHCPQLRCIHGAMPYTVNCFPPPTYTCPFATVGIVNLIAVPAVSRVPA